MAILNTSGEAVVEYTYDAWGKLYSTIGTLADTLGEANPLTYRGYVYDHEIGYYYLQSRYYDPEMGRFINADALVSTGQGFLATNMFAYCRNNPVSRIDCCGTADEDVTDRMDELLETYAQVDEFGFTIDLESATSEWDACIKAMGIDEAYTYMSDYLCQKYEATYGEAYLFSNSCVAYEIEYHVDAYMWTQSYKGYSRNITTYLFSIQELIDHCKTINISTKDVGNFKQETMFNYKGGIRAEYQGTAKDPYFKSFSIFGKTISWR